MKRILGCVLTCVVLVVSGCATVGPDYASPDMDLPAAWLGVAGDADVALAEWWLVFDDPALHTLLQQVREQNRDLVAAVANMDRFAALYGVARADSFPQVGAQAAPSYDRQSERVRAGAGFSIADNPTWIYTGGFTVGWEVDLWGRVRRTIESAQGQLDASLEDVRQILILLQARAAVEYISLRATQARLVVAQQNITLQDETLQIAQGRFDAGLTGEADVFQAEMNLATTKAQVPLLRAQLDDTLNGLCLLAGVMPGELEWLREASPVPTAPDLPGILPAELTRRRPDIRSAERALAAQTARIGAAQAELYPKLALNGSFALASTDTGELFTSAAQTFKLGPLLSFPVFTAGKVRNAVRAEEAATRAALARYEQTVLAAFGECESALSGYAHAVDRRDSLLEAAAAGDRTVALINELYRSGLTDFQRVLDAQRQLALIQDALAQAEGQVSAGLVAVYKAFGGGW